MNTKARFDDGVTLLDMVAVFCAGGSLAGLLYLCWQVGSGHL